MVPTVLVIGWLLAIAGIGLLVWERPGQSVEGNAKAVVVDYYAAVAAHNWYNGGFAFEYIRPAAAVENLWAQREATHGRVAGFTVTAVDTAGGTVTGTLRYADGTTTSLSVPIRRRSGPYGAGRYWYIVADVSPP